MSSPRKDPARYVDRIDQRGDIREHMRGAPGRTLCGLTIENEQDPAGAAPCRRCLVLNAAAAIRALKRHEAK